MERLTERTALGICGNNERVEHYPLYNIENDEYMAFGLINQCFDKLADFEDAEEDGLLIRLPCRVGTEVFCVWKDKIVADKIVDYDIWSIKDGIHLRLRLENHNDYIVGMFGKIVFLTKEEAEQALAKMKGE